MNPITKAQAVSRLYELIDDARLGLKWASAEEKAWQQGRINAAHDAIDIIKAIDSLDEPEPDVTEATGNNYLVGYPAGSTGL